MTRGPERDCRVYTQWIAAPVQPLDTGRLMSDQRATHIHVLAFAGLHRAAARVMREQFLRLTPRLRATWMLGSEAQADLLIIDPVTLSGQMARDLARLSGKRYAELHEAGTEPPVRTAPILRFPPEIWAFARLLECAEQAMSFDTGIRIDEAAWLDATSVNAREATQVRDRVRGDDGES